jgi:hypothetical protein
MQQAPVQPLYQAQPQYQAQPGSAPKKKKMLPLILAIAGGSLVLIGLVVGIVLIAKNASSSAAGEGSALVEILDDAAANRQNESGGWYEDDADDADYSDSEDSDDFDLDKYFEDEEWE